MKRVIIESPYSGDTERNKKFLLECLRDSVSRGEAPIASHAIYPQFMSEETEREHGILLGYEWGTQAELCVAYIDHGVSKGMSAALRFYADNGIPIEIRLLKRGLSYLEDEEVDILADGNKPGGITYGDDCAQALEGWIGNRFMEKK